jgi:hypothetical protein
MLKVSFVVYDPHQTGSIRPPPLHCSPSTRVRD